MIMLLLLHTIFFFCLSAAHTHTQVVNDVIVYNKQLLNKYTACERINYYYNTINKDFEHIFISLFSFKNIQ